MSFSPEQLEAGQTILENMLGRLGFAEFKVEPTSSDEENDKTLLAVQCDKPGRLIGRKGVYIESFELLLNRMLKRQFEKCDWLGIEVDGYQRRSRSPRGGARREETEKCEKMALDIAKEVKRWGEERKIGPYNSAERRAIHMVLRKDEAVETESEGEEDAKRKYVIIRPV